MSRIEEEKRVVEQMIRLYCRKCEGHDELCPSCKELLDYAHSRLERCRYGEHKPTCKKCPVHCYRPQMKERIRMVMRWSGPRMIIYHPIAAIQHLIREIIARRKDCWMWYNSLKISYKLHIPTILRTVHSALLLTLFFTILRYFLTKFL